MAEIIRMTLRLPVELHRQLRDDARKNQRSMHGQIIFILRKYYQQNNGG